MALDTDHPLGNKRSGGLIGKPIQTAILFDGLIKAFRKNLGY